MANAWVTLRSDKLPPDIFGSSTASGGYQAHRTDELRFSRESSKKMPNQRQANEFVRRSLQ
jgi:hypothetical protein